MARPDQRSRRLSSQGSFPMHGVCNIVGQKKEGVESFLLCNAEQ